jgi:RNA polymerase sigma-70 factor (ECF subfamily)
MRSAEPEFREWRSNPSRETLRDLLRAHQDRVFSLCYQVLRHRQDAEDAAQISLIEIARGASALSDPDAFNSWTYRVCLNNALSVRRESRRRKSREERRSAMAPTQIAPEEEDLRDAVHDALARLDDDERALIVEHYFEKASLDDLGNRRGVSAVAVWKRIEQAKEKMKRALTGTGLVIGLTQMNSVLEAAEFVPAPSGFSVDAALSVRPSKPLVAKTLAGVGAAALLILTAALMTSGDDPQETVIRAEPPPRQAQAPQVPPSLPEPAVVPSTPPQETTPQVLDSEGRPLQGALVFPGRWYRLRGDDAFDQFRPHLIKDGVTTDAEGRFKLETTSPFVTAWHDEYTPTTAPSTEFVIKMKARGTLKGRLVDAAGRPREGVEISLDKRGPKVTTDANGAFRFDKVIAGFRGLILPNYRLGIAVRVDPGETLDIEVGPGVDVTLDLSDHPLGAGRSVNAGILGVARLSSLVPCTGKTPFLSVKGVLPGRYYYGEWGGPRGWVDVLDKDAKVVLGRSTVIVESDHAADFYVMPSEGNEIIEVAILKMGLSKSGPGSPLRMEHMTEGDYEIRDREGRTLQTFKVGPGETRVTLTSR